MAVSILCLHTRWSVVAGDHGTICGMAQDGHDLAMTGWPIELRGLANSSEGFGGRAGPGPVN